MAAKSVLDSVLRWRVGTRNKIQIWQDRWLPTPPSFKVVTPYSTMSTMATVDNLIDPITRSWHVSMIDHVFLPHEAEVIKSIPLSNRAVQDIQTWAYTNTGEYSVKSAYKMIQTQQLRSSHGQSPITHIAIKFGKQFGQPRYVIKSKLLFGELVEIYYLQKQI